MIDFFLPILYISRSPVHTHSARRPDSNAHGEAHAPLMLSLIQAVIDSTPHNILYNDTSDTNIKCSAVESDKWIVQQ